MSAKASKSGALERVELLAETYALEGGDYLEHGPIWNAERWSGAWSREVLATCSWVPTWGPHVTRGRLLESWDQAMEEHDAVVAFFFTMVWGLGKHYLGPYKVKMMLDSKPASELGLFLLGVRRRVRQAPVDKHFEALKGAYVEILAAKINHLGPVYASKLLYAMSPPNNRAPVVDVWVKRWGSRYGYDFELDSSKKWTWNAEKFGQFASFCDDCTSALTIRADGMTSATYSDRGFVEYLVFWDSKYRSRKPWPPSSEFPLWVTKVDVS